MGKININLVGEMPFVHRNPTSEIVWSISLRFLKEKFPYKQLYCASDSYITDTPLKI